MMTVLIILAFAIVLVLFLRLRVQFDIADGKRHLFAGFGRTGVELDFVARTRSIKMLGLRASTSPMDKEETEISDKPKTPVQPEPESRKKVSKRERSLRDLIRILPQCSKAVFTYFIGLLKSAMIEECEAEIRAGFEQPDITGMAFGYYQAAIAAVPGVAGRLRYTPDWTGASFSGSARLAVALPLYRLIYRTVLLIFRLPLRELIKLAIGRKTRGGRDGQ